MENSQHKTANQQQQQQQSHNAQPEFQFGYVTNMNNFIQKFTPAGGGGGGHLTQLDGVAPKTCYIAQPLGYNYTVVNQMQLAQNSVSLDGRVQNALANIVTFKCDVCGLMFGQLSLLNAHKKIHAQDTDGGIAVVRGQLVQEATQTQSLVQVTGDGGSALVDGQIQIVAIESHSQQQQQNATETSGGKLIDKTQKCISCNGPITINPKRKGPKLIRCETCISRDNQQRTTQATQIFVAPDGDIKFEMSDLPVGSSHQTTTSSNSLGSQNIIPIGNKRGGESYAPGHHPVKKRNIASVTKCHKCNGSGILFIGGIKSKFNHASSAEKPFHCSICGGSFSRYSSLWSHKKLHSGEKNFKCNICGLAFAKAVYLKNHARIHTGEKPYRCSTCGMQFSQSPHLKNHERTHSGEKPYVCEVCDKGFARHATLWNHRRIHTGEKPYKCDICGSAFSQAAHLKNHSKVHSGEKPFKCDICNAAFADRFALKRHRGIHDKYGQSGSNKHQSNGASAIDDRAIQQL